MIAWHSRDEAETERLGARLAALVDADAVLLLHGELGSGKTVLVRGLARALGVAPGEVQSPSYTLIHEHQGSRGRLVHVDLYRLEGEALDSLGLDELLAGPGIKAIEWAERLPAPWPGAATLTIRLDPEGGRTITVDGLSGGPRPAS